MKLHLARPEGRNLFSGYGPGYVAVNGARYERSIIVLADRIMEWPPVRFEELTEPVLSALTELGSEILILGSGARLRFPHAGHTRAIHAAGIGLEIMDTQAACRTYNVLLSEDRRVAAALLVEPQS
jgi:uncharacterized protein